MSCNSIRICLTITALNDLDVLSSDIENTYLSAPRCERVWMRTGPESGNREGKMPIVRQALYGLNSSGAAFQAFLAEDITKLRIKDRRYLPSQ